MSNKPNIPAYKGRNIGIVVLTIAQLFVGAIHVFFGFLLLTFEPSLLKATIAYDIYTVVFGLLVLVFTVLIWQGKKAGWVGTVAVSLFVIAADSLAVLGLPSIPGIPNFPAFTEIPYSILIIAYLSKSRIRIKFLHGQ